MDTTWTVLPYGFSLLVGVALQLALIGVALVRVRPKRSDAATLLIVSGAVALATTCVGVVTPLIAARIGIEELVRANAIGAIVGALLHALSFGLLLVGIVRLTKVQPGPREF